MADRIILTRKEQFERELTNYIGDDPLKLRYDYLLWLDTNFGKDKVLETFAPALEDALNVHWNDAKYKDDIRFIELLMIYASIQPNPSSVYQSYYDRGVAHQSSILYINWANQLTKDGNYTEADNIFKMGCENAAASVKAEIEKAFERFLASIGRKFLDGELTSESGTSRSKPRSQEPSSSATPIEEVLAWEMNPGKAGSWDDFQTAVAYFDPPDPRVVRIYPKDKVYKESGKEYSLEEVRAMEYFEKRKQKELEEQKLREMMPRKSILGFNAQYATDGASDQGVFPTPLLHCSGKEDSISAQSFTTRTKLAMNLVQDMWSSPTPDVQPPVMMKNDDRENKSRPSTIHVYEKEEVDTPKGPPSERKPLPFTVHMDSPENVGRVADNPGVLGSKSSTTGKKNGLQPKSTTLSERKSKTGDIIIEEPKHLVKQQLHFDTDAFHGNLIKQLEDTAISNESFQPFGGIKPLFPVEPGKDDFSDVTCNTKAFNFALPSSTPVQQRKSLAPYHHSQKTNGPGPVDDHQSYHTQQNLSVILEASKERCSTSGSSTGGSQARTPAFPAKNVPKQVITEDWNEIDPFCPQLNEKLLSFLSFPQPAHHLEGYNIINSPLPTITKTLRLGNDTFTTFGDLGKGAYARVIKASIDNNAVALKLEKPPCKWEYYIAKEIQRRIEPKMKPVYMDIKAGYFFTNGSMLVTEWAKYGNLLNIMNLVKQHTGKILDENLSLYFAIEVIKAVEYLHKCKIIHGDIKPDNFVVRTLPVVNGSEPSLMMIDFGRSIDMSLFPEGTKFNRIVTTEGFQCNEMKDHKPWNYQSDLYGVAGTIYCLLVGDYMKLVKKNDEWKLYKLLPRFVRRDLWDPIFHQLLNIPSCEQLPSLADFRNKLEHAFKDADNYAKKKSFSNFSNIMLDK